DMCIFFFQAEDGIRDRNVTGVQTCALPIYAYTILYLLHPENFAVQEADVQIETNGKLTKGATVTDFKSHFPNTSVVLSVQANIFKQMFIDALQYCKLIRINKKTSNDSFY